MYLIDKYHVLINRRRKKRGVYTFQEYLMNGRSNFHRLKVYPQQNQSLGLRATIRLDTRTH